MIRIFKPVPVGSDILLRALAICMVVFNHSHPYSDFTWGYGGGMNLLLIISGYNFARFTLTKSSQKELVESTYQLFKGILIPSFLMVVLFFILLRRFDLMEFLFVKNWVSIDRVAKFPTWYPQVMGQMLLVMMLLFSIPGIAKFILKDSFRATAMFFAGSVLLRLVSVNLWDTTYLMDHLPHIYFWNFCIGWIIYFSGVKSDSSRGSMWKIIATISICASTLLFYPMDRLVFYWITVGSFALIWIENFWIPNILPAGIKIISQATFVIFLFHRFMLEIYVHAFHLKEESGFDLFLFGLVGSILVWLAGTAVQRAYKELAREDRIAASGGHLIRIFPIAP